MKASHHISPGASCVPGTPRLPPVLRSEALRHLILFPLDAQVKQESDPFTELKKKLLKKNPCSSLDLPSGTREDSGLRLLSKLEGS